MSRSQTAQRWTRRGAVIALLVGVFFPIFSVVTVHAANFTVSVDHQQDDNNACATTGTGACSLRDAVRFANTKTSADTTTITLPAGTYTLTQLGSGEDAALTGDLDILANVSITGADPATTIIDGNGGSADPDRIFDIKIGSVVNIAGVTLRNGKSDSGGAISSADGVVTLTNCILSGNTSTAIGGAIFAFDGGRLTLNGTTLSTNSAALTGGGIYNGGTQITLTNSTVAGNTANASADDAGGGVYNGGTLTITGSILSHNAAPTGSGGGIVNALGRMLTVINSTLTGNTAGTSINGAGGCIGGGILDYGALTVAGSTFAGNAASGFHAGWGGAIATIGGTLTVSGSVFTSNSASATSDSTNPFPGGAGGGIFIRYGGPASLVTNSTFSGNTASVSTPDSGSGFGGVGGGLYTAFGTVTVSGSTFTGNSVTGNFSNGGFGGGIRDDGNLSVVNSTFASNSASSAGGGIDMPNLPTPPTLTVTNATLSGNTAASGGGIANRGSAVTLTNVIVANSPTGGDLAGPFTGTDNLVDDTSAAGFVDGVNGNIIGHPAVLGTLASNGGPTQTMALGVGSPARDAGSAAVCAAAPVNGKDQRGLTRRTNRCSIGAVEADPLVILTPSSGSTTGGNTVGIAGTFVGAGTQVMFGGVAATNVAVVDGTTLTCTAPGHTAGAVDVVIANASGVSVTVAGGYTYGTVNPLPQQVPSGGSGGSPSSLPNGRPAGSGASGGPPAPLPNPRP